MGVARIIGSAVEVHDSDIAITGVAVGDGGIGCPHIGQRQTVQAGLRKFICDQRSESEFSIGVPVNDNLNFDGMEDTAL